MKNIEAKCRRIWFAGVHLRDRHCQITGQSEDKHAHHLFGKGNWVLAFDMDFGACFNTHWHTMFHGTAGFQHGTPAEQKRLAMRTFIDRLVKIDDDRAAKIIRQTERTYQDVSSPCWENVLQWVTEQHKRIADEAHFNDDIEPAFGKTLP